ncbi:hypothetical protein C8R47DRAFT_1062495 [Mycena vitilis]|nr:hypothetical protein C8R47DRAFT_1062495 [Mycena vitilis]
MLKAALKDTAGKVRRIQTRMRSGQPQDHPRSSLCDTSQRYVRCSNCTWRGDQSVRGDWTIRIYGNLPLEREVRQAAVEETRKPFRGENRRGREEGEGVLVNEQSQEEEATPCAVGQWRSGRTADLSPWAAVDGTRSDKETLKTWKSGRVPAVDGGVDVVGEKEERNVDVESNEPFVGINHAIRGLTTRRNDPCRSPLIRSGVSKT